MTNRSKTLFTQYFSKCRKFSARPVAALDNRGFTLLELVVVITLLSLLTLAIAPRFTSYLGNQRRHISVVREMIVKTFDDSFTRNRINLLAIHLAIPDNDLTEDENIEILSRTNGISVVTFDAYGQMHDSSNKLLKYQSFPDTFSISRVILSNGTEYTSGTAFVPFFPEGFSDDIIIQISTDDGDYSVILSKLMKEPYIAGGHLDFESMWESGAF